MRAVAVAVDGVVVAVAVAVVAVVVAVVVQCAADIHGVEESFGTTQNGRKG